MERSFLDCLYCDAKLDTYRVIRSSENFFLALDGAYSSAVEQIVQEKIGKDEQKNIWKKASDHKASREDEGETGCTGISI